METTLKINYYGYFTPFGGYGIANFNWVKHLQRQGIKVYPHGKFMPMPGEKEWDVLNKEEKKIANIKFKTQRIGIIETNPFDFDLIESDIKIANTMAESDIIGEKWVTICNEMDYIIVPNKFQKMVFVNSGVTVPVIIIPHGTETEKFPYFDRPKREIFTFGLCGWLDNRKGAFDLIQAFASEFDKEEPVQLKLHSTNQAFGYYKYFTDPRIITDIKLLSSEKLNEWYQSLDCFVFPSKAEGIGQPPREAMSTGLPVIVTRYSGLEEIARKDIAYPLIPVSYTPRTDWVEQPGNWANIDIQELMYQMRYVYEHQAEAKEKGRKASEWIRANFSWEKAAKQMIEFLGTI